MIDDSGRHVRTAIHLLVETTTLCRRIIRDGQFGIRLIDNQQTIGRILLDGKVIEIERMSRVRGRGIIYYRRRAREVGKQGNRCT